VSLGKPLYTVLQPVFRSWLPFWALASVHADSTMLIRQGKQVWRSLQYAAEIDPYHLVEFVMLLLAIGLTSAAWALGLTWEYWVLGLSLAIGSAACCLVRESLLATPQGPVRKTLATMMLLLGTYTIWSTVQHLMIGQLNGVLKVLVHDPLSLYFWPHF
jgi:hypothetical protein